MKKKFDWIMLAATVIPAAALVFAYSEIKEEYADELVASSIGVGILFLAISLVGFIITRIVIKLRSDKMNIQASKRHPAVIAAALLLAFAAGSAGQYIYAKEKETIIEDTDIVLLIDCSGSMTTIKDDCYGAACKLIDSMDSTCTVKIISFAGDIGCEFRTDFEKAFEQTEFINADQKGKQELNDFINNIDIIGGTEFNYPLKAAHKYLDGRKNNKAVIMLTDGVADVDSSIADTYKNSDITLSTIRISSGYENLYSVSIGDIAKKTGGFDKEILYDSSGNVDYSEVLEAFEDAFDASRNETVCRGNIVFGDSTEPLKLTVQIAAYVILSLIISVLYYGKNKIVFFAVSAVLGAAVAAAAVLGDSEILVCIAAAVLISGAYTIYLAPMQGGADNV